MAVDNIAKNDISLLMCEFSKESLQLIMKQVTQLLQDFCQHMTIYMRYQ